MQLQTSTIQLWCKKPPEYSKVVSISWQLPLIENHLRCVLAHEVQLYSDEERGRLFFKLLLV